MSSGYGERNRSSSMSRSRQAAQGKSSSERGGGASSSSSASYLLQAAALQDHFARNLSMNGAGKRIASLLPGSKPTLAQRYGLVQRAPELLTREQWKAVQEKSRERQDSCGECAICRDEFQNEDQILLSCSHVFHKQCIDAFERFAKQRCCPLCRTEHYQKRRIEDGRLLYRVKCATRIQAVYKGHLVRKAYKKLRRQIPYKDPRLKRRWLEERIHEESTALVKRVEQDSEDLDSFFAELDASVAQSKQQMQDAETALFRTREPPRFGRRATGGEDAPRSTLLELNPAAGWEPYSLNDEEASAPKVADQQIPSEAGEDISASGINWSRIKAIAAGREHQDCPICLGGLHRRGQNSITVLSCTHCFHIDCIACFEAFEKARGGALSCPVCRADYERMPMGSRQQV